MLFSRHLVLFSFAFALFSQSSHAGSWWDFKVSVAKSLGCKTSGCSDNSRAQDKISSKKIALTFDDGPNANTVKVLDVLKEHGIQATFFVLGKNVAPHRSLIRRMVDEGHIVGAHSWNHMNFWKLSADEITQQILDTESALLQAGVRPHYFRYPHGNSTSTADDILASRGYKTVGWHVDTCDWGFNKNGVLPGEQNQICSGSNKTVSNPLYYLLNKARKGGIVLMHDTQSITAQNLDVMITTLLAEGYSFVSLDNKSVFPLLNQ